MSYLQTFGGGHGKALFAVKKPIRFYVLDDKFPEDFAWGIDSAVLNKSGVKGHLVPLSKQEAQEISRRSSNSEAKRSLQDVMLYVKNSYAQTLFDSTKVELSFDQVTRVEIYEYAKGKSAMATTFVVIGAAFTISSGKKDKLSKMDIVGFFSKKGNLR